MAVYKENKTAAPSSEAEIDDLPVVEAVDTDIDDLLDLIDEVLEENAEEFVRGYVQKGGQ